MLVERARGHADVHRHGDFSGARRELIESPFQFVVANLRLQGYNGLHLVHLATTLGMPARAIVYTDHYDPDLAREIQNVGAFYETRACLPYALQAYLHGALPPQDRRNPKTRDRRQEFRGGRRCWDQPYLYGAA